MEDETKAAEPTGAGEAAAGPREEPDYRALYEEQRAEAERLKAESRKWERRSKENLDAAKQARSAARKSVEEEVADLRARLRRMEEERAHTELVSGVASAKVEGRSENVPPFSYRGVHELVGLLRVVRRHVHLDVLHAASPLAHGRREVTRHEEGPRRGGEGLKRGRILGLAMSARPPPRRSAP